MAKHGWAPKWIIVLIHVISEQVSAIKLLKPGNIGMRERERPRDGKEELKERDMTGWFAH